MRLTKTWLNNIVRAPDGVLDYSMEQHQEIKQETKQPGMMHYFKKGLPYLVAAGLAAAVFYKISARDKPQPYVPPDGDMFAEELK